MRLFTGTAGALARNVRKRDQLLEGKFVDASAGGRGARGPSNQLGVISNRVQAMAQTNSLRYPALTDCVINTVEAIIQPRF